MIRPRVFGNERALRGLQPARRGKDGAVFDSGLRAEPPGQTGRRLSSRFPAVGKNEPDPDADVFSHLLGQPAAGKYFAPPRGALTTKLLGDIKGVAGKALEENEVLLVEGSPAISNKASTQLAEALDARVLVAAKFEPGLDASELAGWRELYGDRLLGIVINGRTRYQSTDVNTSLLPSMGGQGLPSLGSDTRAPQAARRYRPTPGVPPGRPLCCMRGVLRPPGGALPGRRARNGPW